MIKDVIMIDGQPGKGQPSANANAT
jgi:hypothetical protein